MHALRIEFKKLRYTVEYFSEVLGKRSVEVINDLKLLQDHLGDLNDAQVATQILGEFIEGWDAQQQTLPIQERQNIEEVVNYLAERHAERHHLMVTFQADLGSSISTTSKLPAQPGASSRRCSRADGKSQHLSGRSDTYLARG